MIRSGDEPIPGYKVEQMLGKGQYGEVWRATSPGRSMVALKFLDMSGRQGWKEFRAVQRVKRIRHAHLMPIVAIWLLDEEGQVLTDDAMESFEWEEGAAAKTISWESMDGVKPPARMVIATLLGDKSLRDRLEECLAAGEEGIPVDELIGYMQEAAKGIDYLNSVQHEWDGGQVGVQHCDIKPDNVMLTGGSVVICDFGVAQILADDGDSIKATSLSGSPAYMAPEAFDAKPSKTSDQYSLAVSYYELRTGQLPLQEVSFTAALDAHRAGALDFSLVPQRELAVLRQATQTDPNRRYGSTADFVGALREAAFYVKPAKRPISAWIPSLAAAIAVLAMLAMLSQWDWGANTVNVTLRFDVPDAQVLINGEKYTTGPDGKISLDADIGAALTIAAVGNESRKDQQWTIAAADLADEASFDFPIPYTAAHYASEAEGLLLEGRLEDAIEAYVLAIQDAPGEYARLPEPVMRDVPGMMWRDCMQVTPGGAWLVTGGKDGTVRRWRIGPLGVDPDATVLHRHENAQIVSLAVTDSHVASACDLGDVWISSDEGSEQLAHGEGDEMALAFAGGGDRLVAAISSDLTTQLFVWDARSTTIAATRRLVGEQPGEFPKLVRCAGDSFVVATKDATALIWQWRLDDQSHKQLGQQQNDVLCLSASLDGTFIAYAGVANTSGEGDEAAMIDVEGQVRYGLASRQSDSIQACALDGTGDLLATAERTGEFDETGTVWVWRPAIATGVLSTDRVLQYDRALGDVTVLLVSRGAEWIAAGHERGALSLWSVTRSEATPLFSFGRGDRVVSLRVTPDQRWMFSGARDGRVMIVDLRRLSMLQQACQRAGFEPKMGHDRLTLRDPSPTRGLRFL